MQASGSSAIDQVVKSQVSNVELVPQVAILRSANPPQPEHFLHGPTMKFSIDEEQRDVGSLSSGRAPVPSQSFLDPRTFSE